MLPLTQHIAKKDRTGDETATECELSISKHCVGIATPTLYVTLPSGDCVFLQECVVCKDALVREA